MNRGGFPAVARTLRDARLDSRESRAKLKPRGKPYWRSIEPGLHVGYRRLSKKPGTWCVRKYAGQQRYVVEALEGVADDFNGADGHSVLSFAQAQRKALDHKPKPDGPLTVAQAVESYLEFLTAHRKSSRDARYRYEAFIRPTLGDVVVQALTKQQLERWRDGLAAMPRRIRTPKGEQPRHAPLDDSDEGKRKRRVSANRVLITLRAALNMAFANELVPSDTAWRRVRKFKGVDIERERFLSADECRRLLNACQGNFRKLVQAALATGCRYGELIGLLVNDFQRDSGTLLIRTSKAGKPRIVWLTAEAQALFARWCAGKRGDELLLPRDDGSPWGAGHQWERIRDACAHAGITPAVTFHCLRHTHASHLAQKGVPTAVIAEQLGHADERMAKRYAHLSETYTGATIRQHALTLGAESDDTVVPLVRP
jgi:integrase